MPETFRIGTRTTPLALWQAHHVADALRAAHPGVAVELVPFVTEGDRRLSQPLPEIGGKGVFTAELEEALHEGRIDVAVHSLKDLPVEQPAGLDLVAVLARADARDAWVSTSGATLDAIPHGALVGTSSLRRAAQLRARRPDLAVESIRGSVETRLRKVREGQYDATLLAYAGLHRLGLDAEITEVLGLDVMLPAPGQAALGVQGRADDARVRPLVATIDDTASRTTTTAERAFLQALGGGCSAPIAAYATYDTGYLALRGLVSAPDGTQQVAVEATGTDAHAVGQAAAADALAAGAREVLNG